MAKATKVRLDKVVFKREYYPRLKHNEERVADYAENVALLPPIVITHEGFLVDGNHRLLAHRRANKEYIAAEVIHLPQDRIQEESARRNASGTLPLSQGDREALALKWWDGGNGKTEQEIANNLSVSLRQVQRYLARPKILIEQRRRTRIIQMVLQGQKQTEVAAQINREFPTAYHVSQSQVSRIYAMRFGHVSQMHTLPDKLQVYNIWHFQQADPQYGQKDYFGRKPGQLIENLLYYYTEPGNLVIDPMSGSGTTLDVCLAMHRRCLAYDLNPVRHDIKKNDITEGYPPECKDATLVFLDPPYWGYREDKYPDLPGQLAIMSLPQYYKAMEGIFETSIDVLKPDGYLAVIIAATRKGGERIDHAAEFLRILQPYELVDRIIVDFPVTIYTGKEVYQAKELKEMVEGYQELIIVRAP